MIKQNDNISFYKKVEFWCVKHYIQIFGDILIINNI